MELIAYSLSPTVAIDMLAAYKNNIILTCTNQTPSPVHNVEVKITYTLEGEVKHEQWATLHSDMQIAEVARWTIKRDKEARDRKYMVQLELVQYD